MASKGSRDGVAIRTDGVPTGLTLSHETVREKSLEERRERGGGGHRRGSHQPSSRCRASCISSGHALRYQYVSLTLTWPR
jgi:hypothetical protein